MEPDDDYWMRPVPEYQLFSEERSKRCSAMGLHFCEKSTRKDLHGKAIDYCYGEPDGTLWATNDEYTSQVNYCPFCGKKADAEAKDKSEYEQEETR